MKWAVATATAHFILLYRKLLRNSYKAKKPSGGCALAREEIVAIATALGASVLRAERFLIEN